MANEIKLVTLPKDVADAIEAYLEVPRCDKAMLLYDKAEGDGWVGEFKALEKIDLMTLASALVNGYQVELSPEEKVAEYYESLFDANQFDKKEFVLVKTLNLLGINIPGVNVR